MFVAKIGNQIGADQPTINDCSIKITIMSKSKMKSRNTPTPQHDTLNT